MTTIRLLTKIVDNPSLPELVTVFKDHLGKDVEPENRFPGIQLHTAAPYEAVEECAQLYLDPVGIEWEHVTQPEQVAS